MYIYIYIYICVYIYIYIYIYICNKIIMILIICNIQYTNRMCMNNMYMCVYVYNILI